MKFSDTERVDYVIECICRLWVTATNMRKEAEAAGDKPRAIRSDRVAMKCEEAMENILNEV